METWVSKLIEDAVAKHCSAKQKDEIAVAVLGGMKNDAQAVGVVVEGVTAEVSRNVSDWKPTLE